MIFPPPNTLNTRKLLLPQTELDPQDVYDNAGGKDPAAENSRSGAWFKEVWHANDRRERQRPKETPKLKQCHTPRARTPVTG